KKFGCGKFLSQEVEKPSCLKKIPRRYKRYGIPLEVFEKELEEIRKKFYPGIIGVTSIMTYWYPGVFEVIKKVKEKFPQVPLVLGGIYATLCFDHAKNFSGADYIIRGKGEIEMLKLIDSLEGEKRDYLEIKKDMEKKDIFPAYHLLSKKDSLAITTSRGCPFRCSYCVSNVLEERFYQKNPEKVIEEIEYCLKNFGVQDVAFYDDALLVNAEHHIVPILEGIIKKPALRNLRFHTPNGLHTKFVNREIAELFYAANFKTIRLSFESISPEVQERSSSKVTEEDLLYAIKNLKKAGYRGDDIGVYILVGLPGQEKKEVIDTIKFVKKQKVKVKIAQFSPIPQTADFEKALKLTTLPLKEEPLFQNNSIFYLWHDKIGYEDLMQIKNLANQGG
ncbi:B12-binding domain-containing radical SAM protein, partial [Candidatus Aerophobetes bacterium]|nr:B12-binding domain-containing radical SAM protein [Candidatus Aerophobetes bacterium]